MRDRTTEIGLVADDYYGALLPRPPSGLENGVDGCPRRENFRSIDFYLQGARGLLGADCRAGDDGKLRRQPREQPLCDARRVLAPFRSQLARQIVAARFGIRMAPQDELHA